MGWWYAPHRAELAEEVEEILWGHVEAQILDEQSTAHGLVSRGGCVVGVGVGMGVGARATEAASRTG